MKRVGWLRNSGRAGGSLGPWVIHSLVRLRYNYENALGT